MRSEEYKKFRELISPIANALASTSDVAVRKVNLLGIGAESPTQTITTLCEGNGFFHVAPGNVNSRTKLLFGLPPRHPPKKPVLRSINHRLDTLKQVMLERRIATFGLLVPNRQALARVGSMLSLHRADFGSRVHHFMHSNVLVAVLDRPQNCFYMRLNLAAADYSDIHTVVRPDVGGASSSVLFEKVPVLDAVWAYAQHDPEATLDLPAELATGWLRLRALPAVSTRMLAAQHMAVISRLLMRDQHIDDLLQGKDVQGQSEVLTSLACLLITRSVLVTQTPLQSMRYVSPSVQKKLISN